MDDRDAPLEDGDERTPAERAADEAKQIEDSFDSRLDALEAGARRGREAFRRSGTDPKAPEKQLQYAATRDLGQGMMLAYVLIGLPLVGVGVGWLIDLMAGTGQTWRSILGLAGAFVAVLYVVAFQRRHG